MGIYTVVGFAVDDANELARVESLERPEKVVAIVTHDKSGVFLSWCSTEQRLHEHEIPVGWWKNGKRI